MIESIFAKGVPREQSPVPPLEIPRKNPWGPELVSQQPPQIDAVPENELVRHFIALSHLNYSLDQGFYPLGSCTMKYNPKVNEWVAQLPGWSRIHPLQPRVDGAHRLLAELSADLCEITGMDAITLQPAAGAHGEFTGLLLIRAYFESLGELGKRTKIIVPDSAHGTNPASAAMCGFSIIVLKSDENGEVPLGELDAALAGGDVAGIMMTNPNTLGLFERNVLAVTERVHQAGGLCYYDGANLNAILGVCRPGDMGFDVVHLNLHKTFSTPHGSGGPGAGPVAVKAVLAEFLPAPVFTFGADREVMPLTPAKSIGKVRSFHGNFGVLVRAYTYLKVLGLQGLPEVAKNAVLNANYLRVRLAASYTVAYDRVCMHEVVLSDRGFPNEVSTEDVAKRLLDLGYHAPTIYFPLIVHGALMIEPTETETKQRLDAFADAMLQIRAEMDESPDLLKQAPVTTPVGRLDATLAARKPVLRD
jgi:glycine dehydrogenase subunit 2